MRLALTDSIAADAEGAASADLPTVANQLEEKTRLDEVLEEARLATGATGAAIALVRGAQMVCCATTGPNAPDLGTALDPDAGLTGCCIQTREIQQCSDTETNPHVDLEACRRLGVRSIVVLPLMDSDQVVGVFEILSSRPDAFGQRDLCHLQVLANRILESQPPRSKADPTVPGKDHAVEPMHAELPAGEVLLASTRRDTGTRRSNYWMSIRTAAVITLAVLLGWLLGHASWEMAVDRAENQVSKPQKDLQPALQEAPDTRSETVPESEAGTLQTQGTREIGFDAGTAKIAPEATNGYVLKRVMPKYPERAKQQHIQGRVVMKVSVGPNGMVQGIIVTSGDPQLVKAAANAVRQWRFKPQSPQGQAVEFETQIVVNFALT